MFRKGAISHYENDDLAMRTPQMRADHFGAVNYLVGENVLWTNYNATITDKGGAKHNTRTYEGLADAIVEGWVHSPGHFKNMTTPEYQITGLAVAVDITERKVYACQKFAEVPYVYAFEESPTLFPYPSYETPQPVSSFAGIADSLLEHPHEWKLKHDEMGLCEGCNQLTQQPPFVTLKYENGSFRLRIEDSKYVERLIRDRKDGFAVEIVTFDDYMCGNPAYYTRPSRRNGQCMLNGTVLKPLYRKELLRGYKKRKTDKGVRFLPFIVGSDSIRFFQRFYQYRVQRYNSEYFEINLGRLPANQTGYWAHNLLYIQDGQICHTDYFTRYCGELHADTLRADFVPKLYTREIHFAPEQKDLSFEIPFKVNQADFTYSDIQPFLDSLSQLSYTVDSIYILARSSIEGDSLKNDLLQRRRAESIVQVLQAQNNQNVPYVIETSTGWEHFYEAIRLHPKYAALAKADRNTVLKTVNGNADPRLQQILQQERKATVSLHSTVEMNDQNCWYFVSKYWNHHLKIANDPKMAPQSVMGSLDMLDAIYEFAQQKVISGVLDTSKLLRLKFPVHANWHKGLMEKNVLYGFQFPEVFGKDQYWKSNWRSFRDELMDKHLSTTSPEFRLLCCKQSVDAYLGGQRYSKEDLQKVLDMLSALRYHYEENVAIELNADRLVYTVNTLLVNKIYATDVQKYSKDAAYSIWQLIAHYEKYDEWNEKRALQCAKLFVHYQDNESAVGVLMAFDQDPDVLAYLLPLLYVHPSEKGSEEVYQYIIEVAERMPASSWCNAFLMECQIPFQAFDHEALRNLFCERCMEENTFLQQLLSGNQ